jgi:hypothetical protein
MKSTKKYGQFIYEYLEQIKRDFDKLNIKTVSDLRQELENRVAEYIRRKYEPGISESLVREFIKGTRDQQCSKVIVNDFKRWNFTVKEADSKFNLFYYPEHLEGFEKFKISGGNQGQLIVQKIDKKNFPDRLIVYWNQDSKKMKDFLRKYV